MRKLIILIIVFLIVSFNLYESLNFVWADFSIIKNFPTLSYDDKMRHKIGRDFYDYTIFLKQNVPPQATIMIPPSRFPWPQTGNQYYLNYFLFPRKLISGDEKTLLENKDITYILLVWGESEPIHEYQPGWPKFPVEAEKIFILRNGNTQIVEKNYDPQKDMEKGLLGVMKIKR